MRNYLKMMVAILVIVVAVALTGGCVEVGEPFDGDPTMELPGVMPGEMGEETCEVSPVAVADTAITDEDTAVMVAVLRNDVWCGSNTTLAFPGSTHGDVTAIRNEQGEFVVRFTPHYDFHGMADFRYRIVHADGVQSEVGVVKVEVRPVDDQPAPQLDEVDGFQNTPSTFSPLVNDRGLGDGVYAVDILSQPEVGEAEVRNVNGVLTLVTYNPKAGWCGIATFKYVVYDMNLQEGVGEVTIFVNCPEVPDPPL